MTYILTTISKVTGETCYYDGYGFSLKRENARLYDAPKNSPRPQEHAVQVSELFNGHEISINHA